MVMSEKFGLIGLESYQNRYLDGRSGQQPVDSRTGIPRIDRRSHEDAGKMPMKKAKQLLRESQDSPLDRDCRQSRSKEETINWEKEIYGNLPMK